MINTLINISACDDRQVISTLNTIGSSHGKSASCWVRPANVDDGLEFYHLDPWSRGLEVARGVVCSASKRGGGNVSASGEKRLFFCKVFG